MEERCSKNEGVMEKSFDNFKLCYDVIESVKYYEELNEEKSTYGVRISKENVENIIETSVIEDITTDYGEINKIIKVLFENGVTPVHLHDIVEDLI